MSDIAIRVEGIGKLYRMGERESYRQLREVLGRAVRGAFNGRARPKDTIWAVRDISFDVHQGEVVGLIGRNGAGKSTLLKLLARITRPTVGWAQIHGRVGSLLEVGTGFHMELTGRENIFLSGAILGMKKAEIRRKFDEIVAFSEVERFLDTPLKHYSSGMNLRLAFAVAAHLEPEILFIDEVLAVGDLQFQKKCLGKMQDVSRTGRTIIFVSHNMAAVTRLCPRCMLLSGGRILKDGTTHEAMNMYLRSVLETSAARQWSLADAPGNGIVRLRAVRVRSVEGRIAETFDIRQPIGIDVIFDVLRDGRVLAPNIHIFNESGLTVFVTIDQDEKWHRRPRSVGRYVSTVWIPGNFLSEGSFTIDAAVTTFVPMNVHFHERAVVGFRIVDSTDGDSVRGDYAGTLPGVVRPMLQWETSFQAVSDELEIPTAAEDEATSPAGPLD